MLLRDLLIQGGLERVTQSPDPQVLRPRLLLTSTSHVVSILSPEEASGCTLTGDKTAEAVGQMQHKDED